MIVLDKNTLLEQRIKEAYTVRNRMFVGSRDRILENAVAPVVGRDRVITLESKVWQNSAGHSELWNAIEDLQKKIQGNINSDGTVKNAAMLPDDYASLIDLIRIDITRQTMAEADYTGVVSSVVTNAGFNKSVRLDEFLPYGAAFDEIHGNNDAVKLLEHKTGATGTVDMRLFAVGDKTSLQETIFAGRVYDIQKVTDAVARGYAAKRNDLSILGEIVAKDHSSGWTTKQKIAADTTAGATKEELLYNTLVTAMKGLFAMKDKQTKKTIDTPTVMLMIPKGTELAFARAINGLTNGGKVGNYGALTQISAIIPYIGDVIYMGKETYTYAGCPDGYAYMFIPKTANWILEKTGLQMEVGQGSVLELSREERAWYFIQSKYSDEFFGGSTDGYGYIVQITLPTL